MDQNFPNYFLERSCDIHQISVTGHVLKMTRKTSLKTAVVRVKTVAISKKKKKTIAIGDRN